MAECEFQTELGRGLDLVPEVHYHKIADMPNFLYRQSKVTFKKPYDCYMCFRGLFVAMELKQRKNPSLKTLAEKSGEGLTREQEANLLAVEASGGVGLVVVNFRFPLSAREVKKQGVSKINAAFVAPIPRVIAAREELAVDAIPIDWWRKHAHELQRMHATWGWGWDPTGLIECARSWQENRGDEGAA